MNDHTVISADPRTIAEQCRHHAVRTAVKYIVDDAPHLALLDLIRSTKRCAHLDNRPLAADRVRDRARALLADWGLPELDLVVVPGTQDLVWTDVPTQPEEIAS